MPLVREVGCLDDPILVTLEIEHVRIAREFGSTPNMNHVDMPVDFPVDI